MQNIFNLVLSVILVIVAFIGGLFTVIGVQCLNSTTPITAILSIGAGSLLCALCLWIFPWSYWYGHWKNYTDRMTEEGSDFPVVKIDYSEEVQTYTQEEMDNAIYAAKDEVANHWAKDFNRFATFLADGQKYAEMAKREKANADFWKGAYEGMKDLNASVEKRADLALLNELRAQRKLTIASIKVEMAELQLDLVKPEVKEKIQKEFGRIRDLLKDASIKVDGNCPEQRASFISLVKSARAIMDGCHIMWIKNHI